MKKASKVFLILAGVMGVFVTIAMAVLAFYLFFGGVVFTVYSILGLTGVIESGGDSGVFASYLIISVALFVFSAIAAIGAFLGLLSTIFAFIACKKKSKLAIHIISIVLTAFTAVCGFAFYWYGLVYLIVFVLLWFLIIVMMLTPVFWLGLSFILAGFGSGLFALLAIVGNVFGIIAISKQKKLEAQEEQQIEQQEEAKAE